MTVVVNYWCFRHSRKIHYSWIFNHFCFICCQGHGFINVYSGSLLSHRLRNLRRNKVYKFRVSGIWQSISRNKVIQIIKNWIRHYTAQFWAWPLILIRDNEYLCNLLPSAHLITMYIYVLGIYHYNSKIYRLSSFYKFMLGNITFITSCPENVVKYIIGQKEVFKYSIILNVKI